MGALLVAALLTVYIGFLCLFMAFVLRLQHVAQELFMPMVGAGCLGLLVGVYRLYGYLSKEDERVKDMEDRIAQTASSKSIDAATTDASTSATPGSTTDMTRTASTGDPL